MDSDAPLFSCRMCGHCCEGKGGIIVSPTDLARLADYMKMPPQNFIEQYCEQSGGKLKIRIGGDGYCLFFRSGQGCRVHEAKPAICRAWPFFRGNLEDPVSFAMAKEFCPGINPTVTHEFFSQAGKTYLQKNGLLAKDRICEANALILK